MVNESDTVCAPASQEAAPNSAAAALSAKDKRALLAELLKKEARQPRRLPLSSGQQRLWLVHELDPTSPVYNIAIAYHFRGPLDADALERALRQVVQRHESLRTTFAVADGRPAQVVAPETDVSLRRVDLTDRPESDWRGEAD